jgi:hypothetical protein
VRIFTALCRFVSLMNPSRMLSVPSFHWHPFGCLVLCLLVDTFGCLWVLPLQPLLATLLERSESFMTHSYYLCVFYALCFLFWVYCWGAHPLFDVLILVSALYLLLKKKKR